MSPKAKSFAVAAGLALAGQATGWAYVFSGWLSHPIAYLAPVAAVWTAAAFLFGLLRSPHASVLRRIAAGCAWVAVPVAAFALPPAIRWITLARTIAETPLVEPEPPLLSSDIDLVRYDRRWDYQVYYHTAVPFEDVCRFYETEIPARGWTVVRWDVREDTGAGRRVLCEFTRDGGRHLAEIGELVGEISLPVHPVGGASVKINPYPESDRPPAFLPRL